MIGELLSGSLWLRLIAQATLCVATGLAASYLLRHRAARAHQVVLTALLASLLMPGVYILARHLHLGVLPPESMPRIQQVPAGFVPDLLALETAQEELPLNTAEPVPWSLICFGGWALLSAMLLGRLVLQFLLGLRLLEASRPLASARLCQAMESAQARMGVARPVRIRGSTRIESPIIWCWLRRPVLLIHAGAADHEDKVDWVGVFCHELAHFKRRDHLSGLLAEALAALLPWHPLLWWARTRLARLSEQACDDWVLASGHSGVNYAETLLGLAAQRQMALVPTAVGKEKTMKMRIHRIVKDRCGDPRVGGRWTAGMGLLATVVVVSVGLAQPQPVAQEARAAEAAAAPQETQQSREKMPDWQRRTLQRRFEELSQQILEKQALLTTGKDLSVEDRQVQEFDLDLLREMAGQIERRLHGTEEQTPPKAPAGTGEWVYRDGQWVLLSPEGKEMGRVTPGREAEYRGRRRSLPEVTASSRGGQTEEPKDSARQGSPAIRYETRVYALEHVSADERIRALLGALLDGPETVTVFASGKKVAVTATAENHLRIEGLLKALDVPAPGRGPEEDHFVTKVYKLQHAGLTRTREIVRSLLGESGEVASNEQTNALIVTATRERLKSIENILSRLDTPASGPASKTEVDELWDQMRQLQQRMEQMQRRLEQVGEQSATKVRPLGTPPVPQRPAETQESAIRR